jgi:hypothetical protein
MSEENKEDLKAVELSGNKSTRMKKEKLLEALEKNLGIVTKSVEAVKGCSRTQYYAWVNGDEEFARRVEDLNNVALDFAESQLHLQMQDGNASSTIFYLKCRGRKRGYIERVDMDHTSKGDKIAPNIIHLGVGTPPIEDKDAEKES